MAEVAPNRNSQPYFFFHADHPFSNHFWRPFSVKGVTFPHLESFLMYCKAREFGDIAMANLILAEADPQRCKMMGRNVLGYNDQVWAAKRSGYHVTGAIHKFGQHGDLLHLLLATDPQELVEASPYDRLWGIGMSATDARIHQRELWGQNLCGKGLMQARQYLKEA